MTQTSVPQPVSADAFEASDAGRVSSTGGEVALRGRGLAVRFGERFAAVDGVDLDVWAGQHVAIVGASGSGKTSLLNCLGGDRPADAGSVAANGRVGRVYQDFRLVRRATALANVAHGAAARLPWRTRLVRRAGLKREAAAWLERVGLEHRAAVRVDRLSGGEQQRVAIARALMMRPAVILADEPVSALDTGSAHAVMGLLRELCVERGIALLSVQHDCALAERYADRIVLMERGKITAASDDPAQTELPAKLMIGGRVRDGDDGDGQARGEASADPAKAAMLRRAHEACAVCPDALPRQIAVAADMGSPSAWRRAAWWTLGVGGLLAALGWSGWMTGLQDVELGQAGGNAARFLGRLVPAAEQWGTIDWPGLGTALLQTLAMAVLGTAAAIAWSLPLSALAARGIAPRWLRVPVRLVLNVIRSVPSILWALLCVGALGLGAVPGMVALAAYSTGYLTKFFYEAFESVEDAVPGALRTVGMSGPEVFLAAVWPASRLAIASSCVFMLEYNFRAASVLGVVGAGGIGYDLKLAVEWANWHVVFVIVLALAGSVIVFDALADRLRRRLA
ncbi:MAG: ATP-binding cassette domain-containing protein [Planctomycetota bacterium]